MMGKSSLVLRLDGKGQDKSEWSPVKEKVHRCQRSAPYQDGLVAWGDCKRKTSLSSDKILHGRLDEGSELGGRS